MLDRAWSRSEPVPDPHPHLLSRLPRTRTRTRTRPHPAPARSLFRTAALAGTEYVYGAFNTATRRSNLGAQRREARELTGTLLRGLYLS